MFSQCARQGSHQWIFLVLNWRLEHADCNCDFWKLVSLKSFQSCTKQKSIFLLLADFFLSINVTYFPLRFFVGFSRRDAISWGFAFSFETNIRYDALPTVPRIVRTNIAPLPPPPPHFPPLEIFTHCFRWCLCGLKHWPFFPWGP